MFPLRLKQLRDSRGMSQADLGAVLNTTQQTINNYEKGKREPSQAMVERIADYFNVSIDYLFGRTDDPTPPKQKKEPNHEEYVLSANTLAESAIRIAELYESYAIDEDKALNLHRLAYKKLGLPPAPGSEEAAHLENDVPATGVFDEDGDQNESRRRIPKRYRKKLRD